MKPKDTISAYLVLAIAVAALTVGCGNGGKSNTQIQPPDVYLAGFQANSSQTQIATSWKNGTATALGTSTYGSTAYAVAVSGSNVYVAGLEGSSSGFDIAKYWLNGAEVDLTDGSKEAAALAIYVDGSDVYAAGIDGFDAVYWKNGTEIPLTTFTVNNSAEAWSIAVTNGNVYVAGWQYVTTQISPTETYNAPVAMLWTNGVATQLSDPLGFGAAQFVLLSGNDVYVAGNICPAGQTPCDQATYWKNGTETVLSTQATVAESIAVSGTNVYVGGTYYQPGTNFADLWTNGSVTQLSQAYSAANALALDGTDLYVGGANTSGGNTTAGYWKNGSYTPVTDGTNFAAAFAIAVVPH